MHGPLAWLAGVLVPVALLAACTGSGLTSAPPAGPEVTSFKATAPSPVKIVLQWSATGHGPLTYTVERNGFPVTVVSTASFTDTPVHPQTPYTYTLIAEDAAGHKSPVATASVSTPSLPALSQARLAGHAHVLLTFTSVVNITNLSKGQEFKELWSFHPKCRQGACLTTLAITRRGFAPAALARHGAIYTGSFSDTTGRCGPTHVPTFYKVMIRVTAAHYSTRWMATRFKGTLMGHSQGSGCLASSQTQSIRGSIF